MRGLVRYLTAIVCVFGAEEYGSEYQGRVMSTVADTQVKSVSMRRLVLAYLLEATLEIMALNTVYAIAAGAIGGSELFLIPVIAIPALVTFVRVRVFRRSGGTRCTSMMFVVLGPDAATSRLR